MISVVIPTYNCNQYLAKTLESVLSQDLGPEFMEIEVVDDCSTESPEFLIDEIGKGRVKFYKQPKNVGHVKNFETGIRRAKGDIIHLLHGDDYVLPGFYEEMLKMYQANPEIGACYCRHFFVDEDNDIKGISELLAKENMVLLDFHRSLINGQRIQTPSITVKKKVYDTLGYFNPNLTWTEDWEMWVRISSKYPIGYIKNPLASYRIHSSSSTGNKSITGENIQDLKRIKKIFYKYLSSTTEKKQFEIAFKKILYAASYSNFLNCSKINSKYTKKHLLTMFFNATTYSQKMYCFLKYCQISLQFHLKHN